MLTVNNLVPCLCPLILSISECCDALHNVLCKCVQVEQNPTSCKLQTKLVVLFVIQLHLNSYLMWTKVLQVSCLYCQNRNQTPTQPNKTS